jgi:hypothetical protein
VAPIVNNNCPWYHNQVTIDQSNTSKQDRVSKLSKSLMAAFFQPQQAKAQTGLVGKATQAASQAASRLRGQLASGLTRGLGRLWAGPAHCLTLGLNVLGSSKGSAKPQSLMLLRHGLCMGIAWGLLAPLTIAVARYGRRHPATQPYWQTTHVLLNALMAAFGITGVWLAVLNHQLKFGSTWHHLAGLGIAIGAALNGLLGITQLMGIGGPLLTRAHHTLGPLLWLTAVGNAYLGAGLAQPHLQTLGHKCRGCPWLCGNLPTAILAYAGTVLALFAALEFFLGPCAILGSKKQRVLSRPAAPRPTIRSSMKNKKAQ